MTTTNPRRIGALALLAVVAIGACTNGGTAGATGAPSTSAAPAASAPESTAPEPGGPAVSGTITVSGSSTVEPISTGVAEGLKETSPDFNYTIEGPGTGDGFKRFCAGETDISDASRKIKDEEAATCTTAGIEYVELQIAYDGITVMTSPENTAIECLSFPDLYALVGPESQGFAKWSDAQALGTELGTTLTYPDASLDISGPGEESGTYDSFVEIVLDKLADRAASSIPPPSTRRLARTTARAPTTTRSSRTSRHRRARSAGSASPSPRRTRTRSRSSVSRRKPAATASARRPRPSRMAATRLAVFYIYVNKAKAAANPAIVGYVDFYLADGTISTVLETVPYVNLPADALAATRSAWEAR